MLNDEERRELLKVKNNEELRKCIEKYNINLFDIAKDKEIMKHLDTIPPEVDPESVDVFFRDKCEDCDFYELIFKTDKEKKCGLSWEKPPKEILNGNKRCEHFKHDLLM